MIDKLRSMNKFIVTTTINDVTPALERFDDLEDWHLIVIGDKKTPKISLKNGDYIPPKYQNTLGFSSVSHIPWNLVQRRNIGYLLAVQQGADIIATIDDDNIPYDNWGKELHIGKEVTRRTIHSDLVCDSLFEHSNVTHTKLWHRGFPVQLLEDRHKRTESIQRSTVDVQAGLWDGDPDVDAVCRLAGGPFNLKFSDQEFLISNETFSPYNTQNTFFSRRVSPCMCLSFDIGRMDDIWASYMTQRVMRELGSSVLFTGPTVYQDRNDHDLTKDLEKEMVGYRNTLAFLRRLNEIDASGDSPIEMYSLIVDGIEDLDFISSDMIRFQRAWLEDMERIL